MILMHLINIIFILVVYQCLTYVCEACDASPLKGSLVPPFQDTPSDLTIVAYSRVGHKVDTAPVTVHASFDLFSVLSHAGDYMLHVEGSVIENYDPVFLRVENCKPVYIEARQNILQVPNATKAMQAGKVSIKHPTYLLFKPRGKTNYVRYKRPWRLKHLWRYKTRFLQLIAVLFIIWFPHFLRTLPKDLQDELMGETKEDNTDADALFKTLTAYQHGTTPTQKDCA